MTCHGPRGAPEPYGCSDCLNTGYCGEWHNQMQELREKLAKAVVALKEALYFLKPTESDMEKKAGIYRIVTTLAEIEGEKQ